MSDEPRTPARRAVDVWMHSYGSDEPDVYLRDARSEQEQTAAHLELVARGYVPGVALPFTREEIEARVRAAVMSIIAFDDANYGEHVDAVLAALGLEGA